MPCEDAVLKLTIAQFAIVVVWSGFILWTIRKFWWSSDDLPTARFRMEVTLASLLITVVSSLALPTIGHVTVLPYWQEVVYWAISLFPMMMWAAYFGFRWFHAIVDRH